MNRFGLIIGVDPQKFEELIKNGEIEEVGAPSIDWLGVPLKIQGRTIGAIAVQTYTEGIRFSEEQKKLLESEGHEVFQKGKKWLVYDFENKLVKL